MQKEHLLWLRYEPLSKVQNARPLLPAKQMLVVVGLARIVVLAQQDHIQAQAKQQHL